MANGREPLAATAVETDDKNPSSAASSFGSSPEETLSTLLRHTARQLSKAVDARFEIELKSKQEEECCLIVYLPVRPEGLSEMCFVSVELRLACAPDGVHIACSLDSVPALFPLTREQLEDLLRGSLRERHRHVGPFFDALYVRLEALLSPGRAVRTRDFCYNTHDPRHWGRKPHPHSFVPYLVRTMHAWEAQDESQLSFGANEVLRVVGENEEGWAVVRRGERDSAAEGLAPSNYVQRL
jgi:hypothetical protein